MLQALFAIIQNYSRQWDKILVSKILVAFVNIHNIIIENEYALDLELCLNEARFNSNLDYHCRIQN
jgi:hypothetical protein